MKKSQVEAIRKGKPVLQIDTAGCCIGKWECAYDAYRETGIKYSWISACCAGKRKSAGGYRWKYAS